jgi:hypothetical protein
MYKLHLVVPVGQKDYFELNVEESIYAMNDRIYMVPDNFKLETIEQMKDEIGKLNEKCDKRLHGLNYWKKKASEL